MTAGTVLRLLRRCLVALAAIAISSAALFAYFVYTPAPEIPTLPGTLTTGSLDVGGVTRTYRAYMPRGLAKGAPLVVVLHGSGENGAAIRVETGYEFDRLAETHHVAVVYPNAYKGDWNACGTVGDDRADRGQIDDVGFLIALVTKFVGELGIDARRVFAAGSSRGGFMAIRLALEAPATFRAVAAVAANVHTPDNFKCRPSGNGTASVMIMNGTKDPLVPFAGGNVSLLGFSYKYGRVMSSRASARYFADVNHIASVPETKATQVADGVRVEETIWRKIPNVEVELVAIEGGGHGIPQPYRRHPRLLGPSPKEPNGPDMIWNFFDRQPR